MAANAAIVGGGIYLMIGRIIGGLAGFATFVGAWIYCVAHYGFLVGVCLGWIPAGIVGSIIGALSAVLWGPAILVGAVVGLSYCTRTSAVNQAAAASAYANTADADRAAATASAVAAADASAQTSPTTPAIPPAPPPPPDLTQVEKAVDDVEDQVAIKGFSGAVAYAMKCYQGLEASPSWENWDRCAAFDQYSSEKFGQNNWRAGDQYFASNLVEGREGRSLQLLSTDTTANGDRLAAMHGLVDQAVASRASRLAARQTLADASNQTPVATPSAGTPVPSFDCSRVSSANLKLICATPSLIQADSEMAEAYRGAMSQTSTRVGLRDSQRDWIRLRNSAPADVDSLKSIYATRTSALKMMVHSNDAKL